MPAKLFAVVCNKIITAISQRQQQKKKREKNNEETTTQFPTWLMLQLIPYSKSGCAPVT